MIFLFSQSKGMIPLAILLFVHHSLMGLPQDPSVTAGKATLSQNDAHTLLITPEDKTIIEYKAFDIASHEKVQFIQPSATSTVLNRVTGMNPSQIFGRIEANGRIFLVNPKGVYFGPSSSVNVGSLVVSTLGISDKDFLEGNYRFSLSADDKNSQILNQGFLSASTEGAVVLLAPKIRNEGIIEAKAGKVLLASGETVALDFTGDGLISFSVEGEIKEAIIEHLGKIHAKEGDVYLRLNAAEKAIKTIVNYEGVEEGVTFIEEDGVIRLVSLSYLEAKKVSICSSSHGKTEVSGTIDVSSKEQGIGGQVEITGKEVLVAQGHVDASGFSGGGTIYIGGDYQGTGEVLHSEKTTIFQGTKLLADAIHEGDGGLIVAWSDGSTFVQGELSSQGGSLGGNGGVIETSGKEFLKIDDDICVNTYAPLGEMGNWLLDPASIVIDAAGGGAGGSDNCGDTVSNLTISPAAINASPTTVTFCASTSITQNAGAPIAMTNNNAGVVFQGSGPSTVITLNANTTTRGGVFTVTNPTGTLVLGADVAIDLTNGNTVPSGAALSINSPTSGAHNLTINTGANNATFGAATTINIGDSSSNTALTVRTGSSPVVFQNTLTLTGGLTALDPVGSPQSVAVQNTTSISGAVSVNGFSTAGTNFNISLNGGGTILTPSFTNTGTVRLGSSGTSFSITANLNTIGGGTNPSAIQLGGTIQNVTSTNQITFGSASQTIALIANTTLQTTNGAIVLNGAMTGAFNLTLNAGTSILNFGSNASINIGDLAANTSLTGITDNAWGLSGGVTLVGGLTSLQSNLSSPQDFGTSGAVSVGGAISVLDFDSNTGAGPYAVQFLGGGTINGTATFNHDGTLTLQGASGGSSLVFANSLDTTSGSGTITNVNLGNGVQASTASNTLTFGSAAQSVTLVENTTITTSNGVVTINGALSGAHNLSINSGSANTIFGTDATVSIGDLVGNTSLTVTSDNVWGFNNSATLVGGLTSRDTSSDPQDLGTAAAISVGGQISIKNFDANLGVYNVSFLGGGSITGPISLLNTGTVTFRGAGGGLTFGSSFDTASGGTSPATIQLGESLSSTVSTNIMGFGSGTQNIVLLSNTTLTTNDGGIFLNGALTGSYDLAVDTGTAGPTFGSSCTLNIGAAVGTISLDVTADSAWGLGASATLAGGLRSRNVAAERAPFITGFALSVGGEVSVSDVTCNAGAYAVSLLGGGTISGTALFSNTGVLTLEAVSVPLTFGANLDTLAGGVSTPSSVVIAGTLQSATSAVALSIGGASQPITLSSNTSLSTVDGNITLAGEVDSEAATNQILTITSGAADVIISEPVGATVPLNEITITSSQNVTLSGIGTGVVAGTVGAVSVQGNLGIQLEGGTYNAASMSFTGPATITTDTTMITDNDTLSFSSTVNGSHSLSINAGTSTISFGGAVGNSAALTSISLQADNAGGGFSFPAAVRFTAGLTAVASNGTTPKAVTFSSTSSIGGTLNTANQTFTGAVTLGANATLNSNSNPILASSTINGSQTLAVNAGSSTASLQGVIGNSTPLTSLTVTANGGATLSGLGGVSSGVSGATSVTSSTGITLNGTTYNAAAQTYTGPVTLGGNITMTGNNNAIALTSTMNGIQSFTANAGTSTVNIGGVIGGSSALTGLTLTGNGGATLSGLGGVSSGVSGATSVTSSTGITLNGTTYNAAAQTYTGPVTLGGNITMTGNNNAIALTSTLNGIQSFTANAGISTVNIGGVIGASSALTALTLTGNGGITLSGIGAGSAGVSGATNVTSSTGITLNSTTYNASAQTYTGPLSLGGNITMTGNNNAIAFSSTINGVQSLSVNAGTSTIGFSGAIGGTSALTSISLRADNSGSPFSMPATSFTSGLTALASDGTTPKAVTFSSTSSIGGTVNTAEQTYSGAVTLAANTTLNSNSNPITLSSTLNGGQTFSATGTTLTFTGAIGASSALSSLTLSGTTVTLHNIGAGAAGVLGNTSVTGSTVINLDGTTYRANQQTYTGPVHLGDHVTMTSTNNPISFSSTIEGSRALSLNAGTSTITLSGDVGVAQPLTTITLVANNSGNPITFGGDTKFTGNLTATTSSSSPQGVTFSGTLSTGGTINTAAQVYDGALTLTGATTMNSNNSNVTINAPITGSRNLTITAGSGTIDFDAAASLDIGSSTGSTSLTITTTQSLSLPNNMTLLGGIDSTSGVVSLGGTIQAETVSIEATGAIANAISAGSITANGEIYINSIGADIGTLSSPVEVNTPGELWVGADPAYLVGTPSRTCVIFIPSNPPEFVIFNGVNVPNCGVPPPGPTPSPSSGNVVVVTPIDFFVPGLYSTTNTLSSYYYFLPDMPRKEDTEPKKVPVYVIGG